MLRIAVRRSAIVALLASSALASLPALAQDAASGQTPPDAAAAGSTGTPETGTAAADASGYGDIVVTAQKRTETLQNVPISIQVLGTQKLQDLNITDFRGYVQQLSSVAFQPSANAGGNPGQIVIYMRGVAAGGEGNHSGPLPAVGLYLDEQPVTTIGGNLDVHIYDVARIESLAGPQGTLYGASSEAGTIRIITNKPDTSRFYGKIDGEVNTVHKGGIGHKVEGMLNMPLSSNAALRVVGWYEHDAGYIDNVAGSRTFCGTTVRDADGNATGCLKDGITVNNSDFVKKNYNDTDVYGGRAALKVELDDNWTVTPQVMYQKTKSHGSYGYDPQVGDLQVQHFFPEYRNDRFVQAAMTIEGKLSDWDVTYAGSYLDRKDAQSSDYTDYAEAYDNLYQSVGGNAGYFYFQDANGNTIDPRQNVLGTDHFKKMSHELRVASPATAPFRIVAGLFYQRQSNEIHQDYQVADLAPLLSVNGMPGTLWLTQQHRVDKDYAMFGEASYDVTSKLTLTAGARVYMYDNSLIGFYGFGRNPAYYQGAEGNPPPNGAGSSRTGVAGCFTSTGERLRDAQLNGETDITLLPPAVAGSPCTNLATYAAGGGLRPVRAQGSGVTYRFNATWKPVNGVLVYGTFSRGFRPGGANRRVGVAPYGADFLTNYEIGWKTTFGRLRLNGAVFQEDWKNFQFAFLGPNSFTQINNGPNARIRGVELDAAYNQGPLNLSASGTYIDAKTRQNLCLFDDPSLTCTLPSPDGIDNIISAPKGTRLPITPRWKLAGTARFTVPTDGAAKPYAQVNATWQSSASSDIRTAVYETFSGDVINPAEQTGRLASFATVNLAVGVNWDKFRVEGYVANAFDKRGQLARFTECGSCGQRPYIVSTTPRTIGLRLGADF